MRQIVWTLGLLVLVPLSLSAQSSAHDHQASAEAGRARSRARTPGYDDLKWQPMCPGAGRRRTAGGDPAGRSQDPGHAAADPHAQAMHVPVHWHSANETHTVIKGTMVFEHGGQPHELGPGRLQLHSGPHAAPGLVVGRRAGVHHRRGPWDINWVNGPPTKGDLGQRPPTN